MKPAARSLSVPCKAKPIASVAAPMTATSDVASIPKMPRIATKTISRMIQRTIEATNDPIVSSKASLAITRRLIMRLTQPEAIQPITMITSAFNALLTSVP